MTQNTAATALALGFAGLLLVAAPADVFACGCGSAVGPTVPAPSGTAGGSMTAGLAFSWASL